MDQTSYPVDVVLTVEAGPTTGVRPSVPRFLVGEAVVLRISAAGQGTGQFVNPSGWSVEVLRPDLSDWLEIVLPVVHKVADGEFRFVLTLDVAGPWIVRIRCSEPSASVGLVRMLAVDAGAPLGPALLASPDTLLTTPSVQPFRASLVTSLAPMAPLAGDETMVGVQLDGEGIPQARTLTVQTVRNDVLAVVQPIATEVTTAAAAVQEARVEVEGNKTAAQQAAEAAQAAAAPLTDAVQAVQSFEPRVQALDAQLGPSNAEFSLSGTKAVAGVSGPDGKGVPFLLADGRLVQRGATGLERVLTGAETDAKVTAGIAPTANALASEVSTRSGVISSTTDAFSLGGVPAVAGVQGADRRGVPFLLADGRLVQRGPNGLETVLTRAEVNALLASFQPATVTPAYSYDATAHFSTPTYASLCYIAAAYGQSNSMGRNDSTDTLISTTPRYPEHALMMGTTAQALGAAQTTLNPLVETVSNGGRETALSGWVNHAISAIDAVGGTRPHFIAFTAGQSGQPIANLGRGSVGYARFLTAVKSATDLAKARGWRPVLPIIHWIQGEADTDNTTTAASRHAADLAKLQRHLEEDVRAITGQREPVIMLITYTAHVHATRTTATQHRIWQAFRMLEGHPGFRFSGPMYQYPNSDVIHLNSLGQFHLGHQVARAFCAEMFGLGWAHIHDDGHRWISNTVFEVDMALPTDGASLVLDTSGTVISTTGIPGYFGLIFNDGSSTPPAITGHSITATGYTNRTLRLTLAAPPGGAGPCLLSYAVTRNADNTTAQDGPLIGARGCLRSSVANTALDGATDYDWCVPFIRSVGRP